VPRIRAGAAYSTVYAVNARPLIVVERYHTLTYEGPGQKYGDYSVVPL
jgi:hypothetical protein